jgi:maltose alpha-D-glucosyltransferase/alpha-amylase
MREDRETQGPEETLRASSETALKEMAAPEEARLIGALEGNLAIGLDGRAVVKIYRNAHSGMRSEVEIARFLHDQQRFHNTPEYFGEASLVDGDGRTTTIAACFSYVRGQGDARTVMVDALARALEDRVHAGEDADRDAFGAFAWPLDLGEVMGRRLGELHEALADDCGDPAFRPEPVAEADVARWSAAARVNAGRALAALATTSEEPDRDRLLGLGDRALDAASALAGRVHGGLKTRVHGDMRIGRFLVAENDVFITGFARPRMNSADGGALSSPLDDLAGALASLDNAVLLAMGRFGAKGGDVDAAESEAEAWRRDARASLLEGYAAARGLTGVADDPLFALFLLDRAFSRVRVEAEAGRPVRLAARFAVEAMASLTASAET